jgi:hypothetical protein
MTKLIILAIIAVAGIVAAILKETMGVTARRRRLANYEEELKRYEKKTDKALADGDMDKYAEYDAHCVWLSERIARLCARLAKNHTRH